MSLSPWFPLRESFLEFFRLQRQPTLFACDRVLLFLYEAILLTVAFLVALFRFLIFRVQPYVPFLHLPSAYEVFLPQLFSTLLVSVGVPVPISNVQLPLLIFSFQQLLLLNAFSQQPLPPIVSSQLQLILPTFSFQLLPPPIFSSLRQQLLPISFSLPLLPLAFSSQRLLPLIFSFQQLLLLYASIQLIPPDASFQLPLLLIFFFQLQLLLLISFSRQLLPPISSSQQQLPLLLYVSFPLPLPIAFSQLQQLPPLCVSSLLQ